METFVPSGDSGILPRDPNRGTGRDAGFRLAHHLGRYILTGLATLGLKFGPNAFQIGEDLVVRWFAIGLCVCEEVILMLTAYILEESGEHEYLLFIEGGDGVLYVDQVPRHVHMFHTPVSLVPNLPCRCNVIGDLLVKRVQ